MKTFLVDYVMDGRRWSFDLMADDEADAQRRLEQIRFCGRIEGELGLRIPATARHSAISWVMSVVASILNLVGGR